MDKAPAAMVTAGPRGIRRGQPAPLFEAEAYWRGRRVDIRLADYQGRYVVLFFYASDFTFV